MSAHGNIIRLSEDDLRKKIDQLLTEYPVLKRIDPDDYDDDCVICAGYEISRQYGDEVGDAWNELQDLYFLLDQ